MGAYEGEDNGCERRGERRRWDGVDLAASDAG